MLALHAAFGAMIMYMRVPHCAGTRIAHCSSCQRAPGSVAVWALTPTCMAAGLLHQAPCKHSKNAPLEAEPGVRARTSTAPRSMLARAT